MAVNNNTIKGSLVILKKGNGATPTEVFTAVAGARNVSGRFGNTKIDATTADDIDANGVTWGNSIPGTVDYELSMQGVMKNAQALVDLMNASAAGTVGNYQLQVKDKFTITGPATISNFEFDGPFDGIAGFSFTVSSAGIQTIAVAT